MAISVFVLRDGPAGRETLIQKRAAGKYHTPGLWANTCCTHPHWDAGGIEDSAACATRRLAEELGIEGLSVCLAGQVEYRADVGSGLVEHEVVDIFTAETAGDLTLHPDPEEVEMTEWVPLAALARDTQAQPALYTPWLRVYLADHAERIFGASIPA